MASFPVFKRWKEVAVLLNDGWHSAMVNFGCVSSRILWIKFKFSRINVCGVVGYGPNEGDVEERERFWNDMVRTVDTVGNGYRLCIMRDLNRWVVDKTRAGITGAFGVPGEIDSGRRVVEFCAERGLCVSNTYFKHRGLEIKSMIDLVRVKRDILQYVQDVRVVRDRTRPLRPLYFTV